MTDIGEASLVLVMEIKRDREAGTLTISQQAYCKSILERFGMSDCKPTSTPGYGSEISNNQSEDTLLDEEETRKYQGIVGSLMYIAQVLRYDIMYATGQLARPMAKPSKVHMVAAKHTPRDLAGTTNFSITYEKGGFKLAKETRKYQGIVGSLMYIAQVLRYDIMYATGQLARLMAKPSKVHMVAAKHTPRDLAGTTNFSITYEKGGFKLATFSDSNWANNPDDGKSTLSYVRMLANAPMSFRSGRQDV